MPDSVIVSLYPDRAGRRYRGLRGQMSYQDYVALARQLGLEPVPEQALPPRDDDQLATAIATDAAAICAQQDEAALVDSWNGTYKPGKLVLWRPIEADEYDPDEDVVSEGNTRSRAFLLGGVAAVWIAQWGMPVALSNVTPLSDEA